MSGGYPGAELYVSAQIEAFRHVLNVAKYFGLSGVLFGPLPLLLQLIGELIGILHAFHVTARAGIAVPVPGTAHVVTRLEDSGAEAQLSSLVEHIESGESGSNDGYVIVEFSRAQPESGKGHNLSAKRSAAADFSKPCPQNERRATIERDQPEPIVQIDVILDARSDHQHLAELGALAENAGIQTVWVSSLLDSREPFANFARLAERTSRIGMGAIAVNPYDTHPVKIAASFANAQ